MALPLDNATSDTYRHSRQAHPNVLARLQSLFPPSPAGSSHPAHRDDGEIPAPQQIPSGTNNRFLKIRILTWNMHESMPKGNLEELLGEVGLYDPLTHVSLEEPSIPHLVADPSHPYHLVVVAAQECPSLSGIPMGIGAGFKLIDKDSHKEKDRNGDKEKEKVKNREKDYDKRPKNKEKDDTGGLRKSPDTSSFDIPLSTPSGWSSTIENWLCSGLGHLASTKLSTARLGGRDMLKDSPRVLPLADVPHRNNFKEVQKGPYQLLVKERMMGLFLAVYIHRDIRSLVRGTSKSAVKSGLIGGRVGNKGGVGISLNLNGTTFLFINAHLAAHGDKVPNRLANLAKIKAELSVDDFLDSADPRLMAEDLTDKFDYSFLCGDLNFRLDLSRLHADWLISREEYAQALEFDQLRNLMRNGQAFVGFHEAPINFPPTFKYDVLRTAKKVTRKKSVRPWKTSPEKTNPLSEVEETDLEKRADKESEEEEAGEATSVSSSFWTSAQSLTDGDNYFSTSPLSQVATTPESDVQKNSIFDAVHKAKLRWISLISSHPHRTPSTKWSRARADIVGPSSASGREPPCSPSTDVFSVPRSPISPSIVHGSEHSFSTRPPSLPSSIARTPSSQMTYDGDDDSENRGVYDSSHKKRVPSWCDRILWKSTVQPDPEIPQGELLDMIGSSKPRIRVGQFLAQAFRPLSGRNRKGSSSSTASVDVLSTASANSATLSSALNKEEDILDHVTSFSRFVALQEDAPQLHHARSIDSFPTMKRDDVETTSPTVAESKLRRPASTASFAGIRTASMMTASSSRSSVADRSLDRPPFVPFREHVIQTPVTSRWRFFPFLSREPQNAQPTDRPPISEPTPPPRKGEVVCLSYDTLDDRAMRRLEGRSDHRPVIGSYAIYL